MATEQTKVVPGLPPLPNMLPQPNSGGDGDRPQWYTSDQMRQYARDAIALATPAPVQGSGGDELSELMLALGLDQSRFRSEGGWLNVGKVVAAIKHPADYEGLYLSPPSPGSEGVEGAGDAVTGFNLYTSPMGAGEQAGEVVGTAVNVTKPEGFTVAMFHAHEVPAGTDLVPASALAQARAECERLRDMLHGAQMENSGQAACLESAESELAQARAEWDRLRAELIARIDTLLAESGGEGGDG